MGARTELLLLVGVLAAGCGGDAVNPFGETPDTTVEDDGATTSSTMTPPVSTSGPITTTITAGESMSGSDSSSGDAPETTGRPGSSSGRADTGTATTNEQGSSSGDNTSTTTGMTTDESTTGTTGTSSSTGSLGETSSTGTTSGSSTSTGGCMQPEPDYDDCFNSGNGVCDEENSLCLVNDVMSPTHGACAATECVEDCDCPAAPATGTALSVCGDILAEGGTACFLDCAGAATCPDGMECIANTLCMWPDVVCEDPPPEGDYADCITGGTAACNNLSATCLQDDTMDPMFGVCAPQGCETDCDCPAAPATGDAEVSCGSIVSGGGNACYLSCAGGQTCPDSMTCFDDFICMWNP